MDGLEKIRLSRHEAHWVVHFDNPPMNVVSAPLTRDLYRVLRAAELDESVRGIVITGCGERAFCAGSDIHEIAQMHEPGAVLERKLIFQNKVFELLRHFPKPSVAALNGLAYGGGLEIALCCDFIVAEQQAQLALPEVQLGLFPSSGGTYRLARRIGQARAKQMVFTGTPLDAHQAWQWGLVDALADTGQGLERALAWLAGVATKSPLALAKAKELINRAFDEAEHALIDRSLMASDEVFASPAARQGVAAFQQRRRP